MNVPTFAKRMEKLLVNDNNYHSEQQSILLRTIKFPKNLMYLSDKLPKQNYQRDFIPITSDDINLSNTLEQQSSGKKSI